LPIGLFSGVAAFLLARGFGERRGRFFTAFVGGIAGLAMLLAVVSAYGQPIPYYASACAFDAFVSAAVPIGVPLLIGAVAGQRIAAIS
jgi:hypothetical protein